MNLNSVMVPPSSVTCDSSCQLSGEQNGPEKAGRFTNLLPMAVVTFASSWGLCLDGKLAIKIPACVTPPRISTPGGPEAVDLGVVRTKPLGLSELGLAHSSLASVSPPATSQEAMFEKVPGRMKHMTWM